MAETECLIQHDSTAKIVFRNFLDKIYVSLCIDIELDLKKMYVASYNLNDNLPNL